MYTLSERVYADREATRVVAANVRAETARLRVSQVELARLLGKSQQAISRRMTGETAWDINEIAFLSEHLEIPLSVLLDGVVGGAA